MRAVWLGLLVLGGGIGLLTQTHRVAADNWVRFRGPNGSGVSREQGIPTSWDESDYAWVVELPGEGHAAPIIYEDKLFVTSASDQGRLRALYCLDAATGAQHWERVVGFNVNHKHRKNSYASSTPTTDGRYVYVAFADEERYTLAAYDFDGNLIWRNHLGPFFSQHGLGVSPIVYEDLVIIPNDQRGPSSLLAFDRETGDTVWSVLREFREAAYSTPIIVGDDTAHPQLICLSGATGMTSFDPRTGHKYWNTEPLPLRTVASPVLADGLLFGSCGKAGKGFLLIAVDPSDPTASAADRIVYRREKVLPYVPTPVANGGLLYLWTDIGVVTCVNPRTDATIWMERVGGNYSGSPICIDDKLYCIEESGEVVVVAAKPEYKLYGRSALGNPSHSTPAVANGRLYLRSFHSLACLPAAE